MAGHARTRPQRLASDHIVNYRASIRSQSLGTIRLDYNAGELAARALPLSLPIRVECGRAASAFQ